MKSRYIKKMVLSAMFTAIAYVLPFITAQIPQIGQMLCPMHLPVILCGYVCGWQWGMAVGISAPLLRSLTLAMPPLYPNAICMALELATYGAVSGLLYKYLPKKKICIYISLLVAMLAGRVVWGSSKFAILGFDTSKFGWAAFVAGAVTTAIPGIIVQIILIPIFVMLFEKRNI